MTAKKPQAQPSATPVKNTAASAAAKPVATKPAAAKPAPAKPVAAKSAPAKVPVASKPVTKHVVTTKPTATTKPAAPVSKPVSKPVVTAAPVPVAAKPETIVAKPVPVTTVADVKPVKARKQAAKKSKPVRDSFTFPEADYALIGALKQRALAAGQEVKKSEVLRAGLAVLNAMSDADLLKVLAKVERIKTGRPGK